MANPLVVAIPASGPVARATTVQNLALVQIFPLETAAAVAAFNALNLASDGTPYPAVSYNGSVYYYDSTDTTSAHDPGGGVITDASGRRYIRAIDPKPDHRILDKDLTAPPGSPAAGDAYYVATGATGAWAGHDGEYAVYGARGWTFRDILEGDILYVDDENAFYHKASGGALTKGLGDLALANASVETKHLAKPTGIFVQASQTTPPGSPSDRVQYIVTATATDAWAGQENKIAEYDSAIPGWVFHTPAAGWIAYDIAAGYEKLFTGSAWTRLVPVSPYEDWQPIVIVAKQPITVDIGASGGGEANYINTALKTFTITGQAGQFVELYLSRILVRLKRAAGNIALDAGSTINLRRDTEASTLLSFGVVANANLTAAYQDAVSLGPSGQGFGDHMLLRDAIADGSAHNYNIETRLKRSSGSQVQGEAELTLRGWIRRIVTAVTT